MYSEPEEVLHVKKIKFLRVVNTLYQKAHIANKKFLYMDYIKPSKS